MAERLVQFSGLCWQCQLFQQDVTKLIQDIDNLGQAADKGRDKSHFESIKRIVGHLQQQHRLVSGGPYRGLGVAFGTAIGLPLVIAIDDLVGLYIGVGAGVAVGIAMDVKARREGRLCRRETGIAKGSVKMWVIIGLGIMITITVFLLNYDLA